MPARRNAKGIVGACVFGVPWLLGVVLVIVGVLYAAPPDQRARAALALFIAFIVTVLITFLAVVSIWYAVYTVWGRETLRIDLKRLSVTRTVLGIPVRFGAPRGFADRVELVEGPARGAGSTRYRLEAHAGRSKIRFGAGVTPAAAAEIAGAAQEFIAATRDRALRARDEA
jgi:hypothetical protein